MRKIREQLASLAHRQWAGWMRYLFSRCERLSNGDYVIPKLWAKRWITQVKTPYYLLSEQEKNSDRKEADKMLRILSWKRKEVNE